MRNISTAVRGHYDDDGYMWAIIIRRFCFNPDVEFADHSAVGTVCSADIGIVAETDYSAYSKITVDLNYGFTN
jgi:hypothetical protein